MSGLAFAQAPPPLVPVRFLQSALAWGLVAGLWLAYFATIGLFNAKAKNVIATCRILLERYDGEVPRSREALELIRGFKGINLIGGDVVEVAPQYDANHNTAHVGAQILFEILSLMVYSPAIKAR